jgi:NAD(P)H-hydrate epimerase
MITSLKTSDDSGIKPLSSKLFQFEDDSHKGQNGKLLIIGGSTLFHAASLWAAEVASRFVDMIHFASTAENNEIFLHLKTIFRNGIVIARKSIPDYMLEDDAILIGPGMIRSEIPETDTFPKTWDEVDQYPDEGLYSRYLVHFLFEQYPEKRYVIDAGALQMIDPEWLKSLKQKAIITPHQLEFQRVFSLDMDNFSLEEKINAAKKTAKEYNCIVLLKTVTDIATDGDSVYTIEGGNPGLTKGGTGDVLAGLTASLYTKNDPLNSAVVASFVLKKTADTLSQTKGNWYNIDNLIDKIPEVLKQLI